MFVQEHDQLEYIDPESAVWDEFKIYLLDE